MNRKLNPNPSNSVVNKQVMTLDRWPLTFFGPMRGLHLASVGPPVVSHPSVSRQLVPLFARVTKLTIHATPHQPGQEGPGAAGGGGIGGKGGRVGELREVWVWFEGLVQGCSLCRVVLERA